MRLNSIVGQLLPAVQLGNAGNRGSPEESGGVCVFDDEPLLDLLSSRMPIPLPNYRPDILQQNLAIWEGGFAVNSVYLRVAKCTFVHVANFAR